MFTFFLFCYYVKSVLILQNSPSCACATITTPFAPHCSRPRHSSGLWRQALLRPRQDSTKHLHATPLKLRVSGWVIAYESPFLHHQDSEACLSDQLERKQNELEMRTEEMTQSLQRSEEKWVAEVSHRGCLELNWENICNYLKRVEFGFFFIYIIPILPYAGVMGCSGAAEATGPGFVCFVVINPCVLSANRVDFGFFLFHKFSNFTPPPLDGHVEWKPRRRNTTTLSAERAPPWRLRSLKSKTCTSSWLGRGGR